jgi:hypothetical protein
MKIKNLEERVGMTPDPHDTCFTPYGSRQALLRESGAGVERAGRCGGNALRHSKIQTLYTQEDSDETRGTGRISLRRGIHATIN